MSPPFMLFLNSQYWSKSHQRNALLCIKISQPCVVSQRWGIHCRRWGRYWSELPCSHWCCQACHCFHHHHCFHLVHSVPWLILAWSKALWTLGRGNPVEDQWSKQNMTLLHLHYVTMPCNWTALNQRCGMCREQVGGDCQKCTNVDNVPSLCISQVLP